MSLILCPVCGNECSADAPACPKCGHPFAPEAATVIAPVQPKVVVRETPKRKGFPNWMFVPLGIVLAVVALGLFLLMSNNREEENQNVNVRLRESATTNTRTNRTVSTVEQPQTVNPPASADSTVVVPPPSSTTTSSTTPSSSTVSTAPPASAPSYSESTSSTTTVPVSDKGNLEIKATIATQTGSPRPVKAEKFYLLNKDLSSILSRAKIEPEAGDYSSTVGAAIADPNRRELLQKILAAIRPHIVASITTDSTGKAVFKNIKPDNYYLFGVTRVGNSASVWDTSIVINPGENTMDLNGTVMPASTSADLDDSDEY